MNFLFGKKKEMIKTTNPEVQPESEMKVLRNKLSRNLQLFVEYELIIDGYCDINDCWEQNAFPNKKLTHRENYLLVKNILSDRYNDEFCEKIENEVFESEKIKEMIVELDQEYVKHYSEFKDIQDRENNFLDAFSRGEIE